MQRARFHRILASHLGDDEVAESLIAESFRRALKSAGKLRRGESMTAWLYRMLGEAVSHHRENGQSEDRRAERLLAALQAGALPAELGDALKSCVREVLPALKPRYAQVVQRVDMRAESKETVARELKLSTATMDVLLHRARHALRKRLEMFCEAPGR